MITGEDLVNEARSWVGTPFHHGAMLKGIGADCIGVVGGIAIACGCDLPNRPQAYPLRANGTLQPYLEKHLVRIKEPEIGAVLLMSFDTEPHHLALFCGETIIHGYAQVRCCIESPIDPYWMEKVRAIYRFKEVDHG